MRLTVLFVQTELDRRVARALAFFLEDFGERWRSTYATIVSGRL